MSTYDKHTTTAPFMSVFAVFFVLALTACGSTDDSIIYPEQPAPLQLLIGADDGVVGRELFVSDGTAGGTALLVDINTVSPSDPKNLVVMGGVTYFVATDGKTGLELWRTNGDTFEQVMDIYEGEGSSDPSKLTVVDDSLLYFTANDGVNGVELWVSDGDPNGTTRMVQDINPIAGEGSYPESLTAIGSTLYFGAYDATHGNELRRYDGISAEVIDIYTGTDSGLRSSLTVVGNTLYFSADDGIYGTELWKSDGTAEGTLMVKDIHATTNSSWPYGLVAMDSALYFTAYSSVEGRELWKSDGTEAGTVLVKDINVGQNTSYPVGLTPVGSVLYFSADDGINGAELWKSDGTAEGTQLMEDIYPGTDPSYGQPASSNPSHMTAVGTALYFTADNGINGRELWKSDAGGTVLLADIFAGVRSSELAYLTAVGDALYFSADNGINGAELWKSDAAGTVLVEDINPGAASSNPAYFSALNDSLLRFTAHDGANGNEIWQSSGTPETTALIADVSQLGGDSNPSPMITIDGVGYFTANDGVDTKIGYSLWRTDGTVAGTALVKRANIFKLTAMGSTLYFMASDDTYGYELWKSDGTAEGTILVKDINTGTNSLGYPYHSFPSNFAVVGSTLYFMADDGISGYELWKSDGTAEGTQILKDIYPGTDTMGYPNSSYPTSLTALDNLLYFSANNGSGVRGLYKSDGTAEGTQLVKDIDVYALPGYESPLIILPTFDGDDILISTPALDFAVMGSTLYFVADDGLTGYELWKSDGTAAGTQLVKDIDPRDSIVNPYSTYAMTLTVVDATLYFKAHDGIHGEELWKSDGTADGTQLVKDIYPGPAPTGFPFDMPPPNLANINGTLYFDADDGITGIELWKSDGTAEGTLQVGDINPGVDPGDPMNLVVVGDTLYFSANDGVIGSELWRTDGTITELVEDINPLPGASSRPEILMHNR